MDKLRQVGQGLASWEKRHCVAIKVAAICLPHAMPEQNSASGYLYSGISAPFLTLSEEIHYTLTITTITNRPNLCQGIDITCPTLYTECGRTNKLCRRAFL